MSPTISFAISVLALVVSATVAWLTFFHKGRLRMTQPTIVYFGPDKTIASVPKNKVYLRTLLYSTAKRGTVVESLHVALHRGESKQNFNIWVYGIKDELERGSGLFVPQEGVTFDHHFLPPTDGANFDFLAGNYRLVIFAKFLGTPAPRELMTLNLTVSEAHAAALASSRVGMYFDWGPDSQAYHAHLDLRAKNDDPLIQVIQAISDAAAKNPR